MSSESTTPKEPVIDDSVDEETEHLKNRMWGAIDNFMQRPVVESHTSTIGTDNTTTPPAKIREHLHLKAKDELKWYAMRGGFALVRKSVAISVLAMLVGAMSSQFTFAQEEQPPIVEEQPPVVVEVDDNNNTGQPQPNPEDVFINLKEIGTEHANVPLRVQIVYPAGVGIRTNVERLNGNDTRFNINTDVGNPDPSQATTTFLTQSLDRFIITLEENYPTPKENAQYFIYVFGNETQVYAERDFFSGSKLKLQLQFMTSTPKHFPTAEENLAAVISPLTDIRGDMRFLTTSFDNVAKSIVYSGNLFQGLTAVAFVLVLLQLQQYFQNRRLIKQLEGRQLLVSEELDKKARQKKSALEDERPRFLLRRQ